MAFTPAYLPLTTEDRDALLEIFSMGISKAADALSQLMHNREIISLSVPEIRLIKPDEFPNELTRFTETALAVKSVVAGSINGITILLFFEDQIEWIVQHCLSDREKQRMDAGTLNVPLLMEISNILTASILTQFTNILGIKVLGLPPESFTSHRGDYLNDIFCDLPPCQPIVLSINTEFVDLKKIIEIPLLILLEIESLKTILNSIHEKVGKALLKGSSRDF